MNDRRFGLKAAAAAAVLAMWAGCARTHRDRRDDDAGAVARDAMADGGTHVLLDAATDGGSRADAEGLGDAGGGVAEGDAGNDAGRDAGNDAGLDGGIDAGLDAGSDAGRDAGSDAGPTCIAVCGDGRCMAACESADSCPRDCGPLVFDDDTVLRSARAGDWAFGRFKAECGFAQAVRGLSSTADATAHAHALLCTVDDEARYAGGSRACEVRDFTMGNARGTSSSGDWSYGYNKGECAPDEYVAGIAQVPGTNRLGAILCCPGAVLHTACAPRIVSADETDPDAALEWNFGFHKATCAPGRYVAGVSASTTDGRPRAILCCGP